MKLSTQARRHVGGYRNAAVTTTGKKRYDGRIFAGQLAEIAIDGSGCVHRTGCISGCIFDANDVRNFSKPARLVISQKR